MTPSLGRTALLERVVSSRLPEEVTVSASLERDGRRFAHALPPFALCLELLAETASVLSPRRFMVHMRDVVVAPQGLRSDQPVQGHAVRHGEQVEVTLSQEATFASASVVLSDALHTAPTLSPHDGWAVDRRQRSPNARELYAKTLERPTEVPQSRQFIRWAYQTGLGQLTARVGPRFQHFDVFPASIPMHATPALAESLEQLVAWQWYALAGEDVVVRRIARADWFRAPRPDEELMALVACRGSARNQPVYDAMVCGSDLQLVLQMQGMELGLRAAASLGAPPRAEWNSFVRVLEGAGESSAE